MLVKVSITEGINRRGGVSMGFKKSSVRSIEEYANRKVDYHVTGSTRDSVEKVKGLLPKIGDITRVIHYRDDNRGDYVTFILGTRGAIKEEGGLSSGYGGEGVRGLRDVLEACGYPKDKAWELISAKASGVEKLEFEI